MYSKLQHILASERDSWLLWLPVLFGVGIICYFQLANEPELKYSVFVAVVISIATLKYRHNPLLLLPLIALLIISLGFITANVRALSMQAPIISKELGVRKIVGTIADIHSRPTGKRFVIEDLQIEHLPLEQTPKRIRLNINTENAGAQAGDRISLLAALSPPPKPVIPGGYDFARYAYFQQLGAVGYSVSKVEISNKADDLNIKQFISQLRQQIVAIILSDNDKITGNIAAALLVGERGGIDKAVLENIRQSGIAHILAISGMHLSMVAAIFFFLSRAILASIGHIAMHYNTKKIAAIVAIAGSFAYLLLSGAPISAQRAFVMTTLILIAVMIDRAGTPMRSIALAASLILLLMPESILTPSFQMSFAAVIALVSCYEFMRPSFNNFKEYGLLRKLAVYLLGIISSSLIAGAATAPFAIYHFNHFASYGMITNLIAIPVTSIIVMPFGVVALLLMPLGLEQIALVPMLWGIDVIVQTANYIANLPQPITVVAQLPQTSFALICLGGIWFLLLKTKLRYAGAAPLIIGIAMSFLNNVPDVIIGGDGKLFAVKDLDGNLLFSSRVKERYSREQWQKRFGQDQALLLANGDKKMLSCDGIACVYKNTGYTTIIAQHPLSLQQDCDNADILINLTYIHPPCKPEIYIARYEIYNKGTHTITFNGGGAIVSNVASQKGKRLWGG